MISRMFEDKFKKSLEKKEFSKLNVKNVKLEDKQDSKSNLTPLISCSENYFEDLLKVYVEIEKVLKIDSNMYLNITGTRILYLIVNKDSNLFLDIKSEKFEGVFIKILVK